MSSQDRLRDPLARARGLGSANTDCRQDGAAIGQGAREGWLFNSGLQGIENADAILIVGANPRVEAPLLNARIRKTWLKGAAEIGVIGEQAAKSLGVDVVAASSKMGDEFVQANEKMRMLILSPKARGLGLGARLTDECIAFARAKGYKKMVLWTNSCLAAARGIYAKRGFKLVKSEPYEGFGQQLVGETWELKL